MIKEKGFTIIELAVVIVIIVVLGSIFSATLNIQRAKARDTKRMADLKIICKALELHYNDHDNYPEEEEWVSIEIAEEFANRISPYVSAVPRDPLYPQEDSDGYLYSYQYISSAEGRAFKVHAELEIGGFMQIFSDGGEDLGGDLGGFNCYNFHGVIICSREDQPSGESMEPSGDEGGEVGGSGVPGGPFGGNGNGNGDGDDGVPGEGSLPEGLPAPPPPGKEGDESGGEGGSLPGL